MTEGLRMKELNITSLFAERIAHTVIPDPRTPDQVGGDIKDTVYQTTGIALFVRMRFPIKLVMTVLYTKSLLKVR